MRYSTTYLYHIFGFHLKIRFCLSHSKSVVINAVFQCYFFLLIFQDPLYGSSSFFLMKILSIMTSSARYFDVFLCLFYIRLGYVRLRGYKWRKRQNKGRLRMTIV